MGQTTLPPALLQSLQELDEFDREAFTSTHASGEQVTSVRLNPAKDFDPSCSVIDVSDSVPWCPYGRYLRSRPSFTMDPLLHAGAYYVQEASSMFLWHIIETRFGSRDTPVVLDLCAAPGGKSTLLASYFTNGLIVSNEVIRARASILVENMTKWGSGNCVVTNNDPGDFGRLPGFFDLIVVDAPCSGSGLFRKDPAAIEEWSPETVALCSARQQRILADSIPALKKDGILIYSTCSYSEEEDEGIADWLLDNFQLENLHVPIETSWGIVETSSRKHQAHGYRFFPDKVKGEGFFVSVFRKKNDDAAPRKQSPLTPLPKHEATALSPWIRTDADTFFFRQGELVIAFPPAFVQHLAIMQNHLYLRQAGITLGEFRKKDFVPDHALALSHLLTHNLQTWDLDYQQSIRYLKKQELESPALPAGWTLVRYCNMPLGWVKVLQNRINNYYPTHWRILKD